MQINSNQNLLDVAIQESGTVESVFELAKNNGISITKNFQVGAMLDNTTDKKNKEVLEFYKRKSIKPATK